MLRLRLPQTATLLIAGVLLAAGTILAALYVWSPHATLRITTGPLGGAADRFVSALIQVATARHPRIRFETVSVGSLEASSKALEQGAVDLALVRSDASPPGNGATIAILRRDILAVVSPGDAPIKYLGQLSGKTIALAAGPAEEENARAFDLLLDYFNVPRDKVKRLVLPVSQIAAALHGKRVVAALAVGPIAPGAAMDVVAAVARAGGGAPKILEMDEADAIAKRFPAFESVDIPAGALKARPETPGESIKAVALSYRLVAPQKMLNIVAGAIGRSIFLSKSKLMAVTPLASEIEAPDPEAINPILPAHPGVVAYLQNGDQSFSDVLQQYLYVVGIPLSLLGSLVAMAAGWFRARQLETEQERIFRLLVISEEATKADAVGVEALEIEFNEIVAFCVNKLAEGALGPEQYPGSALAIEHARRALERRKAALMTGVIDRA